MALIGAPRSALFAGNAGAKIALQVRGVDVLLRKLQRAGKVMPSKSFDAMKRVLIILEAESVRLITSGYYRPAVDTGRLRRSITHRITKIEPVEVQGVMGTNVYYAIYVHEGTIYMEKRSFLTDALVNKQKVVQAIFVDAYRKGLKQVSKGI
jgi:HK97 gp10 family phage protein